MLTGARLVFSLPRGHRKQPPKHNPFSRHGGSQFFFAPSIKFSQNESYEKTKTHQIIIIVVRSLPFSSRVCGKHLRAAEDAV